MIFGFLNKFWILIYFFRKQNIFSSRRKISRNFRNLEKLGNFWIFKGIRITNDPSRNNPPIILFFLEVDKSASQPTIHRELNLEPRPCVSSPRTRAIAQTVNRRGLIWGSELRDSLYRKSAPSPRTVVSRRCENAVQPTNHRGLNRGSGFRYSLYRTSAPSLRKRMCGCSTSTVGSKQLHCLGEGGGAGFIYPG